MFWIGLAIGMFIGANVELFLAALCVAAARGDRQREAEWAKSGIVNSSHE
jgi:hypothetical protein